MATATHLCGIKTPYNFSKRALRSHSLCSQQRLNFDQLPELCVTFRVPSPKRGRSLKIVCDARKNDVLVQSEPKSQSLEGSSNRLSCIMKFGGSLVASSDRMKEVAELILSFPEENPVIVLSAMGKTTNKLIAAGEKATSCGSNVSEIDELRFVKELHYRTVDELGLDKSLITEKLERLPNGIAVLKELTPPDLGISVDVEATSEVSISLTLDPSKFWSRELIQQELDNVVEELEKIAKVKLLRHLY